MIKTNISAEKQHIGNLIKLSGFTEADTYLEIGTRFGQSLLMAIQSNPKMKIISVDVHQLKDTVNAYKDRVKFMEFESDRACRRLKSHNTKISAAFIDGDHSYKQVKKDIENCMDMFNKKGFIAGHDFTKRKGYGVMQAVKECFGLPQIEKINRRWKVKGGELHIMHTVWVYIPTCGKAKYNEYLKAL